MTEPTSRTETLEVEIDGEVHRGERVLLTVDDREIHQEIRFKDLRQTDPRVYVSSDAAFMAAIARVIFRILVERWKARERKGHEGGPRQAADGGRSAAEPPVAGRLRSSRRRYAMRGRLAEPIQAGAHSMG